MARDHCAAFIMAYCAALMISAAFSAMPYSVEDKCALTWSASTDASTTRTFAVSYTLRSESTTPGDGGSASIASENAHIQRQLMEVVGLTTKLPLHHRARRDWVVHGGEAVLDPRRPVFVRGVVGDVRARDGLADGEVAEVVLARRGEVYGEEDRMMWRAGKYRRNDEE